MKSKLDARTVATLALPDGKAEEIFWDADMDRFGLRLRRSGERLLRSWIVQYRRAGANRRMTIGAGEVLSPEQARAAARKALAKVDLGEDPQGDRAERRDKDKLTFRSVVAEYLASKRGELSKHTVRHITAYLTGSYFRPLHGMAVDRIERKDIAAQLVRIARENGHPTSGQARTALSAFFSWAMRMGLVDANPVIGTVQHHSTPRERVLSDTELAAIWNVASDADDWARVFRLLILLPCRRSEIGGMAWSELDLERGTWTLPKQRSKNKKAITLPLMPMALDIIKAVPRRAGREQLFGHFHEGGFSNWAYGLKQIKQRTGIADWVLHDLRRSVATKMADIGVAPHIIEQILNHQSGHKAGPAGIYNRSTYEREVRAALALWEDHIRTLTEGSERKVLTFPAGAVS